MSSDGNNKSGLRIAILCGLILALSSMILFNFLTPNENGNNHSRGTDDLRFSSVFTPLQGTVVNIPEPERDGNGGGMTSWGNYLVVITHEGKIYFVDQNYKVIQSGIEAPFNGFEDYLAAAAKPPFDKYDHNFTNFRYNDITYFESNNRHGFLVSYTKYDKLNACYTTTISRLYVDETLESNIDYKISSDLWSDIYQTSPCLPLKQEWRAIEGHMAGGRIAFDGDKTLYLSSGDYSWDGMYGPRTIPGTDPKNGPAVAQDPNADYGKVIAIDLVTEQARQISRGHRNMQGITIDRNGRVWTVEHGARGGDELNLITEGENYGWPQNRRIGGFLWHRCFPSRTCLRREYCDRSLVGRFQQVYNRLWTQGVLVHAYP